jgi:uncharacterized DUF497 family protein
MQSFKKLLFQWDRGNSTKSLIKHKVSKQETEEAFYHAKAKQFKDIRHSTETEARFLLYSETKSGKRLYIAFTMRGKKIRPISSRPMNEKEREIYEKTFSAA